ncbi:MAG: hypothetical protein KA734_03220 [Fluviicola sp.]|nr:hypothetical protein [Fluviicola sp.]MBP6270926.1 hypothetical protein [Fluviicola sp.]
MKDLKKWSLYPNCIIVQGYSNSIVLDIYRQRMFRFDSELVPCFEDLDLLQVLETKALLENSIIKRLVELDYLTSSSSHFESTNSFTEYESPFPVDCWIVELKGEDSLISNLLVTYLQKVGAIAIQLIFSESSIDTIKKNLLYIKQTNVDYVEVVVKEGKKYEADFENIFKLDDRVRLIFSEDQAYLNRKVEFVKKQNFSGWVIRQNSASNISDKSFDINEIVYLESLNHHPFYNKRFFLDASGFFMSYQDSRQTLFNINSMKSISDIQDVVQDIDMIKFWDVSTKKIEVCMDCEFRNCCITDKIPMNRNGDNWYYYEECNYNPYIAKWEGEDGYLTLAECGVISNENEFSIDHENIALINKELWGDE